MSAPGRVVAYRFAGGLGNRMFQLMLAHVLAERIPDLAVTGPPLPEWGIAPPDLPLPPRRIRLAGHEVDLARLSYLLGAGIVDGIETEALGCRMELLSRPLAQRLFPALMHAGVATAPDELVINIRAAEILGPVHPGYRPLPLAFYARLIAETGLKPVFVGQLGEDRYSAALRARFPAARIIPSASPMQDFATLRAARHLVVAVSTFSWLAAWLSEAETIHLPLAGVLHPGLRRDVDLVPLGDPRWRFHLFPAAGWGGTAAELDAAIDGSEAGREATRDEVAQLAAPDLLLGAAETGAS
ncbi:hypothetical protein [Falsiroseomonas oryziterrae]|uniref:hypothetical protein n=1 Tax=Falsiroseomonas oryziterrae TaxID=2911368 RepID=UPI001F4720E3|nr:hypothetical protein [Roseomonas sp. NPKOSM-4]